MDSPRSRMKARCRGFALVAAAWLFAAPAVAITFGQLDTFQSGTLAGWTGGSNPINQPTGGPSGVDDRYLQISSGGPNGNLGTFNDAQWSDDYAGAGVTRVNFDLNNFGPDPVSLRVMLLTPGCALG